MTLARQHQLYQARAGAGGRVDCEMADVGERAGEGGECSLGEPFGDLAGLGEAVQHGIDDLVVRAGADRVMCGVANHLPPGDGKQRCWVALRRQEQRRQRLGDTFQRPLAASGRLLDVHPIGGDAHQQVGAGACAQFAVPCRQPRGRGTVERLFQRRDRQLESVLDRVGLLDHSPQPGLGLLMVGAVHEQDRPEEDRPMLLLIGLEPPH